MQHPALLFQSPDHDGSLNLALEETLLMDPHPAASEVLFLWQNSPCVIVGRHQCVYDEVHLDYTQRNGIEVFRRMTGGGAVYQDMGNLNVSLLCFNRPSAKEAGARLQNILIAALEDVGVSAKSRGRNDLEVSGRKISGTSGLVLSQGTLVHGTLLVHVSMEALERSLDVNPEKLRSRGLRSVRARTVNIADLWHPGASIERLCARIMHHAHAQSASLSEDILQKARERRAEKYARPSWNFGSRLPETIVASHRFPWGTVSMHCRIEEGRIRAWRISGDFFALRDLEEIEERFVGLDAERESLQRVFRAVPWDAYIMNADAALLATSFGSDLPSCFS